MIPKELATILEDGYTISPSLWIALQEPFVLPSKLSCMTPSSRDDFWISTIKLLTGINGFVITELATIETICVESKLMWSWDRTVVKHVWEASIFFLFPQILLKEARSLHWHPFPYFMHLVTYLSDLNSKTTNL